MSVDNDFFLVQRSSAERNDPGMIVEKIDPERIRLGIDHGAAFRKHPVILFLREVPFEGGFLYAHRVLFQAPYHGKAGFIVRYVVNRQNDEALSVHGKLFLEVFVKIYRLFFTYRITSGLKRDVSFFSKARLKERSCMRMVCRHE